jgi:hypothetical protein
MQSVATTCSDRTGGIFTLRVCSSADAHFTLTPIEDGHCTYSMAHVSTKGGTA